MKQIKDFKVLSAQLRNSVQLAQVKIFNFDYSFKS